VYIFHAFTEGQNRAKRCRMRHLAFARLSFHCGLPRKEAFPLFFKLNGLWGQLKFLKPKKVPITLSVMLQQKTKVFELRKSHGV